MKLKIVWLTKYLEPIVQPAPARHQPRKEQQVDNMYGGTRVINIANFLVDDSKFQLSI